MNDTSPSVPSAPTFAVVIPLYNGRAHIEETVRSVLAQTYPASEVIVVEDGSPLASADQMSRFPTVTYVLQRNTGVSGARNHGASIASSQWVCFLDQDDILLPDHLQQFADTLTAEPDVDLLYTPRLLLLEKNGTWATEPTALPPSPRQLPEALLKRCPFPPSGVCVRRSVFEELKGYSSRYDLAEDWEFWVRCMRTGRRFVMAPHATVCYRVHPQSNSHRPLPILQANNRVIQETILPSIAWPASAWRGRQLISRQEAEAAILLRQLNQNGALPLLLRSLLRFPLGQFRRYKIASHMLLHSLLPKHTAKLQHM